MKRLPAAFWILLPLLLGLLYFVAYPLFQSEPGHEQLAPPGAVLVERFRDFDTFDRDHYFPVPEGAPAPSAVIGLENNVHLLPGVDRSRPLYIVKMQPSRIGTDPTLVLFPLADADRFETTFNDPEMLEQGRIRRAKHYRRHGTWAAVGANRRAVREVGRGRLFAEDRGEDYSIAADVPGLALTASAFAHQSPWREALGALGVTTPLLWMPQGDGDWVPQLPAAPRLARVVAAWREVRLWSWRADRRVELELVPVADSAVAKALAKAATASSPDAKGPQLRDARMWAQVPGGALPAVAEVMFALGIDLPETLAGADPVGAVTVLATRATGHPYAVTYAIALPASAGIDLAHVVGPLPQPGGSRPLAAGAAPLTLIASAPGRKSPAGTVTLRTQDGMQIVGIGADAPVATTRMSAFLSGQAEAAAPVAGMKDGWRLLLAFAMDPARAERVLGGAVGERGLFSAHHRRAVRGEVRTDGKRLRVTLTGTD